MKNYAEEIAYWYFRLNGFFLLQNYVAHKSETGSSSYADSDLIGIRTKHVSEVIGLVDKTDICTELMKVIPNIGQKTIGLICEVKGGATQTRHLSTDRIEGCVKRMGIVELAELAEAVRQLKSGQSYGDNDLSIHKVYAPYNSSDILNWSTLPLATMRNFIIGRISKYDEKAMAWNHYESPLLQYLLYESRENGARPERNQ